MYKDAKKAEEEDGEADPDEGEDKNPFEDSNLEFLEDVRMRILILNKGEFNEEVDGLIEWCEGLDYDKYVNSWLHLATSASSDKFIKQVAFYI